LVGFRFETGERRDGGRRLGRFYACWAVKLESNIEEGGGRQSMSLSLQQFRVKPLFTAKHKSYTRQPEAHAAKPPPLPHPCLPHPPAGLQTATSHRPSSKHLYDAGQAIPPPPPTPPAVHRTWPASSVHPSRLSSGICPSNPLQVVVWHCLFVEYQQVDGGTCCFIQRR
jgi:hypothetical protein